MSCGTVFGNGGAPTSTRWQPMSKVGFSLASRTASSNAGPVAISVVAVRMPLRCASTIPWLTSRVKPKSSALTISRRTLEQAELDAQELLGIRPEILHQPAHFNHGAIERLIQRRIIEQLRNGSVSGADLVDQCIYAAHGRLELVVKIVALEQLARGALTRVEAGEQLADVRDGASKI